MLTGLRERVVSRLAVDSPRAQTHTRLVVPAGRVVHNQRSRPVFVQLTLSLFPPLSLSLHELTLSRIAFTTNDWAVCVVFNVCSRVKVVPVNFRLPHYTCSCKTVELCYGSSQRVNFWKECFWLGIWYHLSTHSLTRKLTRKIFAHSVQGCCEVLFFSFVNAVFSRVPLSLGVEL